MNRISGIDFEIGVIDRIFGCGTLVVSDASEQGRVELRTSPASRRCSSRWPRSSTGCRGTAATMEPEAETARDRLERAILGEERVFNALEVADETGVTIDQLRRLWRALGFPEHGLEVAFTKADAEAVQRLNGIVETGVIDFDTAVNLTRAVGQTMARLSDWEVGTLAHRVEELSRVTRPPAAGAGPPCGCCTRSTPRSRASSSTSGGGTSPRRWPGSRSSEPTRRTCTPPTSPSASSTSSASRPCPTRSGRPGSVTSWSCSSPGAPTWWPRSAVG